MNILKNLRKDLIAGADEKIAEDGKRFFKEYVKSYGYKSSVIIKMSKEYFK